MIEIKNLHFSYNNRDAAIRGIDLTINDHEWISIIGHNGCGKSTLAKLLVGLLEPTSGEIHYDGAKLDIKTLPTIRKKVGIVFQNPDNQFVGYNVKYDIAFGLENHNVERQKMIELIDTYTKKVSMNEFLGREPQTLSGGEKQRVAIAGILALDCDYIILDEATSMLDPEGSADIINLIKELHNNYNKTIISITHDLDFASLSDRVVVMKEGKIIKEGKPIEVFKDEETLHSSSLDLPVALQAYSLVSADDDLKNNKELKDALWEYYLKK